MNGVEKIIKYKIIVLLTKGKIAPDDQPFPNL